MQDGGGRMRNGRMVSSEKGGEAGVKMEGVQKREGGRRRQNGEGKGVKMEERTQKCGAAARAGVGHKKWKGPTAVGPFR